MTCAEIPVRLVTLLASGIVLGLVAYLLSRLSHNTGPAPFYATEAGASGCGLVAGLHLAYGALCPQFLVHLVDETGRWLKLSDLFVRTGNQFRVAGLSVELGEIHTIHILLGAIATVIISGTGLYSACKRR